MAAKKLTLQAAWDKRCKLRAEGLKLQVKGNMLRAEGRKFWAEGLKLQVKGDKFWAKGDMLWAEGDKLRAKGSLKWATAILAKFGDIKLRWSSDGTCELENGEVYKPKGV